MSVKAPYLTLVGGLAVAGVLLALSSSAVRRDQDLAASSATDPSEATAATAPASPSGTDPGPDPGQTPDDASPTESAEPEVPAIVAAPKGTYAGSVKGGGASVAVVVKGGKAIAYVCDGSNVEAWLQGSAADASALALTGKAGAKLTAKYADGRLSGTIRADGRKWTFRVKTVKSPSGLYRAAQNVRSVKVVGGWIIYENRQVGMLNRGPGVETPAPPIDLTTGTVTIDGVPVTAAALDGPPAG